MEKIKQLYRERESLLDRVCPRHLKTWQLRYEWDKSIDREYRLLTEIIVRLEKEG